VNSFGIKISNTGHNADSSKNENTLFNSNNDTIQIYKKIPFELIVPEGEQEQTVEIKHEFSFMPLFACWAEDESGTKEFLVPSKTDNFYTSAWSTPEAVSINFSSQAPGWYADRDYKFNGFLYIFRMGME
jgi:hypothetical protein